MKLATRVKVCGLTRPEDARLAGDLGAWACGMILSRRGPRALDRERALAVRRAIPEGVLAVGVVVDETAETVNELARDLALDLVQLHGSEPLSMLAELAVPAIKVVSVAADAREPVTAASLRGFEGAWGILFDAKVGGERGGTGRTFAWELLGPELRAAVPHGRLVLAGGLGPGNVAEALERVRPFAVDLASGVESAPGVKDRAKLESLFDAVRAWEQRA